MKSTGIIRKLDELGRIVIPKETRKIFNLKEKDAVEIFIEKDTIVLKKYEPGCRGCNKCSDLTEVFGIKLCNECIAIVNEKSAKIMKSLK